MVLDDESLMVNGALSRHGLLLLIMACYCLSWLIMACHGLSLLVIAYHGLGLGILRGLFLCSSVMGLRAAGLS